MSDKNSIASLIQDGKAALQVGDLARARSCCESVLQKFPDHAAALHLLGQVYEQTGDRKNALRLVEQAVAINPKEPVYRLFLAELLEKGRQFSQASKHLLEVVKAAPNVAEPWMRLARAELINGKAGVAARAYRRAYELDSGNYDALIGYGAAVSKLGNHNEAVRAGEAVLQTAPAYKPAFSLATTAAAGMRDWKTVLRICERWLSAHPGEEEAVGLMANAYFELGEMEKARDVYETLVKENPSSAKTWTTYARCCLAAFDYESAGRALERARALAPASGEGLYALSRLKMYLGELDEAEALCLEAIEREPAFAMSYVHYAKLRSGDVEEGIAETTRRLAENQALPAEHRASLHFSVGDISNSKDDCEDAMRAYSQANAITGELLRIGGIAYDKAQTELLREREFELFETAPPAIEFSPAPATPIFIVGMPRSGTTLIESIIAAHPDVYGAGEVDALPFIHHQILQWAASTGETSFSAAPAEMLKAWRDQYFSHYPKTGDTKFVTDKQPLNFRSLAFIKQLFPEAPIVHIRRNPVDTGFSIYRNDFWKAWPYAAALDNIAHFYGEYTRLAAHWELTPGSALAFFQYEDLITNFEAEARRLIGHCGLDWRDECMEFHQVKRPVATFSAIQVRQPLRKSAVSAMEKYGALLQPLIDGLGRAGVDIETGALLGGEP